MNAYAILEPIVVSMIIATCAGVTLRRIAPNLLATLGSNIRNLGLPDWLADLFGKTKEDRTGCSSCNSCQQCSPSSVENKHLVLIHRNKPQA
jgi:hypothetical protein